MNQNLAPFRAGSITNCLGELVVTSGLKVFVLGPARSGTSILYYALQKVFSLPGEGESHIMPGFQRVVFTFARYCEQFNGAEGVLARQLDATAFRTHVIEYLQQFYAGTFPDGNFVDKTPGAEAIAGLPLIREAFPDAKVIVTRRSGIEVVQSHIRKFGTKFSEACEAWSAAMEAIRQVKASRSDFLEIEQHELVNSRDLICAKLATHLDAPEKLGELDAFLAENKVDRVSDHDWRIRLRLAEVAWDAAEKETFMRICGAQMEKFGYAL